MARSAERLLAIDWLRGLVMALMAIDHVDQAINPNHAQGDGAMLPGATTAVLSAPDFTVRWLTHLCAPTFVLLAGVSVALSAANARERGSSNAQIDRHLVLRGGVIVLIELTLVSHVWRIAEGGGVTWFPVYPLVLWAIGGGIMLMPLFRRLPATILLAIAAALMIWSELTPVARFGEPGSLLRTVMLTGGLWWAGEERGWPCHVICLYPLLTWLPAMLFGIVLGRLLVAGQLTARLLVLVGVTSLGLFAALRGLNAFGNLQLFRRSNGLLEWLHCSKYPPSITFFALELGLAFLILALFIRGERLLARVWKHNPLAVLGRVPLFYYLLHLPVIGAMVLFGPLPGRHEGSAGMSLLGTLAVVAVCWPLCGLYGWYKQRYRHAWTRFL